MSFFDGSIKGRGAVTDHWHGFSIVGVAAPSQRMPIKHVGLAMTLLLVLSGIQSAWADLTDSCPRYVYLGNKPGNSDKADWSEVAQGVANDGTFWFFTNVEGLFKYRANWQEVNGQDEGRISRVGFPPELTFPNIVVPLPPATTPQVFDISLNHFGDPDHYGGYVFVPFEGPGLSKVPQEYHGTNPNLRAVIGVFRASDLAFVDWADLTPYQPKSGWVAVDPVARRIYTSDDELKLGTPLLSYEIDLTKVENGVTGDFLGLAVDGATVKAPIEVEVRDFEGAPLAGHFEYMQGGVFSPWGDLFLVAGKADENAEDVRGGIHLFRRKSGSAFELIKSSRNEDNGPGSEDLFYEYRPTDIPVIGGLGEEPEGIDWWNRDNTNSIYPGQLHAILLDNELAEDDEIWLKHYSVDYYCVRDEDSDGDGVTDGDEVYLYNTHPLLLDSDLDGLEDELDNCPFTANSDQSDLDGDGLGDPCDNDSDGDGQLNSDELACNSDPLDPASIAPDFDGDSAPDCVDLDDDEDGQSDADELACGSNPLDADSVSADFDSDELLDCLDPDDDNDGVLDESDSCAETVIPEALVPGSGGLKTNRYALIDNDFVFDRSGGSQGKSPVFTTSDTGGCSATQIALKLGLRDSHLQYGIPRGILESWIKRSF